jgi:hypothetical protein
MGEKFFVKDIEKHLQLYAKKHECDRADLDFHLRGCKTYIESIHIETYEELSPHLKKQYEENRASLLEDKVTFIQAYKIEVLTKKELSRYELIYDLEFDNYSVQPKLILSPESNLDYIQVDRLRMTEVLTYKINKIKAENRLLVNLFSASLEKQIQHFIEILYSENFTEPFVFKLFNGIQPIMSISKEIRIVCEKPDDLQFYEVTQGQLVAKYTKPLMGENGFNAHGQQIECGIPKSHGANKPSWDKESILVKEIHGEIHFYARIKGILNLSENHISIDRQLKTTQIKRLDDDLVTQAEDNSIEIIVNQYDESKDGIAEGVELTSNRVHIKGHIAAHASIKAKTIVVDGATHKSSFIESKEAKIHLHKGAVQAKEVLIDTLEGGVVHAESVEIKLASGGEIYANKVFIHNLKNHVKIYAGENIHISQVLGEDNLICIDGEKVAILNERRSFKKNELEEVRDEAKSARVEHKKKLQERINDLKREIALEKFNPYKSTIKIDNPIGGINIIRFILPAKEPKIVEYRTVMGRHYDTFHLIDDGEYTTLLPIDVKIKND